MSVAAGEMKEATNIALLVIRGPRPLERERGR